MKGPNSKPNASENGNCEAADWEMRPGGMLVQRREEEVDSTVPLIKIKIYHETCQHDVTVAAQSTFGELKRVVAQVTGLAPEEQRLLFRGKEKADHEYLHMAGVKDMSKVVLLQDHASRERKIEQMQRDHENAKACEAVASIRHEVDKLFEKVNALESSVHRGTMVADQEFVVLTELLMRELLKLDSVEAEGEAKVQRRTEVRRIQHYVEMLDALKLATKNPNPFINSSNGTSITTQWQTFDSGRMDDDQTRIRDATHNRVRVREPSFSCMEVLSPARRRKYTHLEPSHASTDWSTSPLSQRLPTSDNVPSKPMLSVDARYGIPKDFEVGPSGAHFFYPQAMSEVRELMHKEAITAPTCTQAVNEIVRMTETSLLDAPSSHIGMPNLVPEGADYQSEIYCRLPSFPDPRNKDIQDNSLMFLQDAISRLTPKSPESLNRFVSYANATLDLLAITGLGEADLKYWEALCREAEFLIRQMKSLSIVRTGTSLLDLQEQVKIRQEAVNLTQNEFKKSVEAMQRHHHRSASIATEIDSISTKIKGLGTELANLISSKANLYIQQNRQARVIEREQRCYQVRHRAMMDAEAAQTRSVEDLQIAETENQSLATIMSQLQDLPARFP